jgi:hypothetical protein
VQEAVLADGGLLYENRSVLGLGYRTRASLHGQDPALVLDYTAYNLAAVPVPVEDDRYVQNKVTVTVGGVTGSYEATDGTLSTALPPAVRQRRDAEPVLDDGGDAAGSGGVAGAAGHGG